MSQMISHTEKNTKNIKKDDIDSSQFTFKQGALVEKKSDLPCLQRKVFLHLASMVESNDSEKITMPIEELHEIIHSSISNGSGRWDNIEEFTKTLVSHVVIVRDLDSRRTLFVPLIASTVYAYDKGTVTLKISNKLISSLLSITSHSQDISKPSTASHLLTSVFLA